MNARVLLIDNYDSFTYNLFQGFAVLGAEVLVHRNDALTVEAALGLAPTHLVVSPGPGRPEDAGISIPLISAALGHVPILGVCLGHQALAAGRYHSLAVAEEGLPDELTISAYTSEGEIMGLRHRSVIAEGVQFHPESVLTPEGDRLLRNFLDLTTSEHQG